MLLVAILIAVVVLSVLLLTWAWRSSGKAPGLNRPIGAVEYSAQWVDRDQPHNSSTCMQMGFEVKLGW